MAPSHLLALRVVVGSIWLYEGLWKKVLSVAPNELAVVTSVGQPGTLSPLLALGLIGAGETLLGLGVLSGLFPRFVAWFQAILLLVMNVTGILLGGGAIPDPVGLLIHNLPFWTCIVILGVYGPGPMTLALPGRKPLA